MEDPFQAEYRLLMQVLEENYRSPNKNLWQVSFHWWRYYFHLNKQLDKAKTLADRVRVIEEYIVHSKVLMGIEEATLADIEGDLKKIGEERFLEPTIPPHIRDMVRMMQNERGKFTRKVRAIKREKGGVPLKKNRVPRIFS